MVIKVEFMSYTALYRKFRPATFEDVKGQEHIVTTLKKSDKSGAYFSCIPFFGTRGTGKTSIAKIFARAVNCENVKDVKPLRDVRFPAGRFWRGPAECDRD